MPERIHFHVKDEVRGELERLALAFGWQHPSKVARRVVEELYAQGRLEAVLRAGAARYITTKSMEQTHEEGNADLGDSPAIDGDEPGGAPLGAGAKVQA